MELVNHVFTRHGPRTAVSVSPHCYNGQGIEGSWYYNKFALRALEPGMCEYAGIA